MPRPLQVGGQSIPWSYHQNYDQVRDEVLKHFSAKESRLADFAYSPKVVFLCGGADVQAACPERRSGFLGRIAPLFYHTPPKGKSNRQLLEEYFRSNQQKVLTFRAEEAWAVIEKEFSGLSALEHEEKLAESSDAIVIILESFGTAAELGAFALQKSLRKRLLVILDQRFERDQSFINLGPVRWMDADSLYRPAIYTSLRNIITIAPTIEKRLRRPHFGELHAQSWRKSQALSAKERLFVLSRLVYVLGVVPRAGCKTS